MDFLAPALLGRAHSLGLGKPSDFEKAKATSGIIQDLLPENEVTSDKDGETFYALPLPASELPLKLPEVENYQPAGTGESPLATIY